MVHLLYVYKMKKKSISAEKPDVKFDNEEDIVEGRVSVERSLSCCSLCDEYYPVIACTFIKIRVCCLQSRTTDKSIYWYIFRNFPGMCECRIFRFFLSKIKTYFA